MAETGAERAALPADLSPHSRAPRGSLRKGVPRALRPQKTQLHEWG